MTPEEPRAEAHAEPRHDARERVELIGEARSMALTEAIPVCVWAAPNDGRIHYCNRAWREYAGPEVGRNFLVAVPDEERDQVARRYREAIRRARPIEWEQRLRRHDGALRWHLIRMVPERDERGEVLCWLLTATDIDAHKRIQADHESGLAREAELRSAAESASRAKDELLATVSHELRTPLNAILGWTAVLRNRAATGDALDRALHSIERSARAQAMLLADLSDVSSIVVGKLRVEMRPTDLHAVVEHAVDVFQPEADAKGVTLQVSLEPGSWQLTGDPDRLQQVVWNLLANATKFTPPGGCVTVLSRCRGADAIIEVRDTGIGIARDFLPYVFDLFRQGHGSATRRQGGLGLGLSIVRHLVELHGGVVHAWSEGEGKGATFTVRLPLGTAVEGPDEPNAAGSPLTSAVYSVRKLA